MCVRTARTGPATVRPADAHHNVEQVIQSDYVERRQASQGGEAMTQDDLLFRMTAARCVRAFLPALSERTDSDRAGVPPVQVARPVLWRDGAQQGGVGADGGTGRPAQGADAGRAAGAAGAAYSVKPQCRTVESAEFSVFSLSARTWERVADGRLEEAVTGTCAVGSQTGCGLRTRAVRNVASDLRSTLT